jgi:hypothetical protein
MRMSSSKVVHDLAGVKCHSLRLEAWTTVEAMPKVAMLRGSSHEKNETMSFLRTLKILINKLIHNYNFDTEVKIALVQITAVGF